MVLPRLLQSTLWGLGARCEDSVGKMRAVLCLFRLAAHVDTTFGARVVISGEPQVLVSTLWAVWG